MKFFYLLVFLVITGCASFYRSIDPQNFSYEHPVVNNCLKYDYQYDILASSKNRKLSNKELRHDLRVVGVELTNLTDHDIIFSKDIKVFMGESPIMPVIPGIVKARIHQVAPWYLFYCLGVVQFTKTDEENSTTYVIPLGIPIAIANMIVASSANQKFMKDLIRYDLSKKVIRSGETVYGIVSFNAKGSEPLRFQFRNEICGNAIELVQVENDPNDLRTNLYYVDSDLSFENYIQRMKKLLKQDKGVISFEFIQERFGNGNIRYQGMQAFHKYGEDEQRAYKIGTWEYFFEDGTAAGTVEYDMTERSPQKQ
jgi:hypothetical protein